MVDIDPDDFVYGFLEHGRTPAEIAEYNKAYYLRNRKLKGRATAPGQKLYEDQVPVMSPDKGKLVDFANGRAVYSDGTVLDSNGWSKTGKGEVSKAQDLNTANKRKNGILPELPNKRAGEEPDQIKNRNVRMGENLAKFARAKKAAEKLPPRQRAAVLKRLGPMEKRLVREINAWDGRKR